MNTENNFIDYGIYIDRKQAFIISLNHNTHEELIGEEDGDIGENMGGNTSTHQQNSDNEQLKKYCKSILETIDNANNILIFGPSVSKFELQKELRENKRLKHVNEDLAVTDELNKHDALAFVKGHYSLKAV
jgi:TPP-dependent 2-oxoacid decarboxylase